MKEEKVFGSIRLFQIGDLQCRNDCIIPEHEQCCFEITYAVSGKGTCILNGKEMELRKGIINVALKDDRHTIVTDPEEPLRFFFFSFDLLLSHPFYKEFKLFQQKFKDESGRNRMDSFNIADVFVRCLAEFSHHNEFSDMLIESSLNQIICYVFQSFRLQHYFYSPKFDSLEVFVYSIINYVEENIMGIESVDDVFKVFNYSASYISHVFSRFMNKSLARYILDCKLEKARALLEGGAHNITQVSEILGYSSIHSFSRAFKKRYKVSPRFSTGNAAPLRAGN
jgi:AraC-like DNA-binding protein